MSEQPVSGAPPVRRDGGGNVFTQKIGPLPMWGWLAIAAGLLVVWRVYAGKKSASSQASTASSSTPADQVPQFVNQVYTSGSAPSSTPATSGTAVPSPTTPTPPGQPGPTTPVPPTPITPQQIGRTVANAIASVTGLHTTGAGATNVGLSWNPSAGATDYEVRVTYQDKVVKKARTNGKTSYNVTGLSPNRTYGLHVVAINGNQWAPETSITQKTT